MHSRIAAPTSHRVEGGRTPAQPPTRNPASRNSRAARGRWARSLTSSTERPPHSRSSRAVSRAFPRVSCDPVSTSNAASGTPRSSAIRRMISASGTGPAPPPDSTSSGAAPCSNSPMPRSNRRPHPARTARCRDRTAALVPPSRGSRGRQSHLLTGGIAPHRHHHSRSLIGRCRPHPPADAGPSLPRVHGGGLGWGPLANR